MMTKKREIQGNEQAAMLHFLEQTDLLMYQFQYDPLTDIYSFPYCSPGIQHIYEVQPEDVTESAAKALNRVHPEDIYTVFSSIQDSMDTLTKWNCDYRVLLPSKGVRWLRGTGNPELLENGKYLWNGYIRDITSRKKVEQELEENKQRLQFALEGSRDGVWDWDVVSGETFYSKESKRMTGFDPDEDFGTADFWSERVHPDDQEAYYQDIQDHFNGKTPYYINEHRIRCKNGNYKWILDRGKVIARDAEGKALRVIGTHSDIDIQKKRESDFVKTIGVIESQNERLLNFAHIVSHNLKSHSGNFDSLLMMIKETEDIKEKMEYFNYLQDVSTGLSETIVHLNQIVSVQTKITNEVQVLDLHAFVSKTIHVLQGEIASKNALIENLVPSDLRIEYNPAYLESILLNLVSNGLKYADEERQPLVKIETKVQGDQLILRIIDNGVGIDLNTFGKRLFGMYQTFHGNDDAKGIGLFLTKNQLSAMGDDISVQSVVGEGSTFQITFHNKQV